MRTVCKLGAESIEEMDRFIFDGILFLGRAEAAGHIEGVSYGVNQEGQLRVVIESDQALPYKTKILEGEAHILLRERWTHPLSLFIILVNPPM